MDHSTAKAIVMSLRRDLTIDDRDYGSYVSVRSNANGAAHSIPLPVSTAAVPLTEEQERGLFVVALDKAANFLQYGHDRPMFSGTNK